MSSDRSITLPCGLTVIAEPMPWLRTAAFTLCVPGGVNSEPDDRSGLASLVCEMVQRGAGDYSSREVVAIQDNLGLDRNSGVSTAMANFGAAMPAESLGEAFQLYADIVLQPRLPADQLEDAKMMAIQELRAIDDEPTHRVMRRLRQLQFGDQLGRSSYGTAEGISATTHDDITEYYRKNYHSLGAILSVAGRVDVDEVFGWAQDLFSGFQPGVSVPLAEPTGVPRYEHIEADSSQTHIGFSFDSIPYGHEDYFRMRAGVGILSDGMSSRLFDRVREQRGLCYSVSASCFSLRHTACVIGYAGTTPERAQETLDVTISEIQKVVEDLQPAELERWKVRIQSGLIMEQESSASRASSLASDYYQIGRVVPPAELERSIESLTLQSVQEYWLAHSAKDFCIVTLGPDPLNVPVS